MTATRTGSLVATTAALLVLAAPAGAAPDEPVADTATLSVHDGTLEFTTASAVPTPIQARDQHVTLPWDTSAIQPGTLFGDTVRLRATVVEGAGAITEGDTPRPVPIGANGVLDWTIPDPGTHLVQVDAEANRLDGTALRTSRRYTVEITARPAPDSAAQPRAVVAPTVQAQVAQPRVAKAPQAQQQAAPQQQMAAQAQQPTVSGRVVLDRGHVDAIAPRLLDDRLHIQVKDGTVAGTTTWREPADVEFRVTAATRTALPASQELAFLGAPGKQIFLLPQTQQADILWTGWSTEELKPADIGGPVVWTLAAAQAPGPFGLFTTGSFGVSTVIFNSTDGLPDTHTVALGTHAHANWVFSEPGTYRLTFAATTSRADGTAASDTETYTFVVGDGTGTTQPPADPDRTGNATVPNGTPRLASTGPAQAPAISALALALLATGTTVLVAARRRPTKEMP